MGEYADYEIDRIMDEGWGCFRKPRRRQYDPKLAARRVMAHNAFDPIWQSGEMSRSEAYAWLADEMMMPRERCHMERMSIGQCDRVIDICTRRAFEDLARGETP